MRYILQGPTYSVLEQNSTVISVVDSTDCHACRRTFDFRAFKLVFWKSDTEDLSGIYHPQPGR